MTLLAEHHGRVRGVAASARKSRRRFGGVLEPMTHVTASWTEREGRELHRIEALDLVRSFATMQSDPARQAACAVLSEITASIVREEQADPRTFRLLGALLSALEGGLDPWVGVRYAEYWLLELHGVLPDLEHCSACGKGFAAGGRRFATDGAGVVCARCPRPVGAVALRAADLAALAAFRSEPPSSLRVGRDAAGPGGPLERLLKGALQQFAERTFRAYRHLSAATGA